MKKLVLIAMFSLWLGAGPLAAQEKTVVGGSGAMGDAMEVLVKSYKQKNPSDALEYIAESMSTTGGIEGTKAGRLTVGIVTRHLTDQEKKDGLVYRPASRVAVVVGVHKSLTVSNLSEAQVCDVFSGKIKSWKEVGGGDAKIVVLGRKKDDNNIETLRDKMACFKNLQLTGDAVLLVRGTEVLDAINNRPGTVGASVAGPNIMERPNIKPLAIAAVAPTLDAVKGGKYRYFNEIGFVTKGEPKGTAKRFVDFVSGPEGEKVMEKFGLAGAK
jgi:phosphate transport system substrate-binding protein